jgi:hypothetical protein
MKKIPLYSRSNRNAMPPVGQAGGQTQAAGATSSPSTISPTSITSPSSATPNVPRRADDRSTRASASYDFGAGPAYAPATARRARLPGGGTRNDKPRDDVERNAGRKPDPNAGPDPGAPRLRWTARLKNRLRRHDRLLTAGGSAALTLGLLLGYLATQTPPRVLTQADIDAAVIHTLSNKVLPSPEARAFANVQRSVVRVRQLDAKDNSKVRGVGTGVVVVDSGTILTSLHVVAGADKIEIEFADGSKSTATLVGAQPENDLAVLQAKTIPDDLPAATLRSTKELVPGDKVIAVGFPFGIGPSVSSGIISGMRREYHAQDGKRTLSNLIQFDAAANPGNSGGPLVTMDGAVVGVVTAILNPSSERVFIGIGFAVPIENAASAVGMSPF